MTIGQVNIILVLKGLPIWQRKWGEANEKWKRDWVLSDVDWEELRERARPELDEALSVGDKVFFAKVKKGLQVLQPLAEDAKDTSEYKLIKYIEEYVKKFTLVWGDDEPQPEQATPEPQQLILPEELKIEEAETYFSKAIKEGWIEQSADGLKWIGFGSRPSGAQLAYLCGKIYGYEYQNDRNEGKHIPYKALEELFSMKRLDRSLKQAYEAKSPQPWRQKIDALFD